MALLAPSPGTTTIASELVGRATALIPALKERAPEAERLRRIPDETVAESRAAGLVRTLRPAHYGGHEQDYRTFAHICREIGRGCASTGWCCGSWLSQAMTLTMFPEEAQDEVCLAEPDAFLASIGVPSGKAEQVAGGWLVNGRWGFASGVHATTWMIAGTMTPEKAVRMVLFPTHELEILDTWHSVGLKGTGSTDTVARDIFVPEHRTVGISTYLFEAPAAPFIAGPLAKHSVSSTQVNSIIFAPAAVGNAQGFIDAFVEAAPQRSFTYARVAPAGHTATQIRLAESALEVDVAEMLLERCYDEMERHADTGHIPQSTRSRMRRDTAYAVNTAYRAINRLFEITGGHALLGDNELQRRWRDAHAIASQPQLHWDYEAETWSRLKLALGTDHPALPGDLPPGGD